MEKLTDEEFDKAVAARLGWTELHGGPSEGGMFLRGLPPGVSQGPMKEVPDFSWNILTLRDAVTAILKLQPEPLCVACVWEEWERVWVDDKTHIECQQRRCRDCGSEERRHIPAEPPCPPEGKLIVPTAEPEPGPWTK